MNNRPIFLKIIEEDGDNIFFLNVRELNYLCIKGNLIEYRRNGTDDHRGHFRVSDSEKERILLQMSKYEK